jgi:hypothetical protein
LRSVLPKARDRRDWIDLGVDAATSVSLSVDLILVSRRT